MAQAILLRGGAGGVGSDDVTASKAQVLQGYKTVTTDSNDEVIEGTIQDRGIGNIDGVADIISTKRERLSIFIPEGYYHKNDNYNRPWIWVTLKEFQRIIKLNKDKILESENYLGEQGTIPIRGYKGPDSSEFSYYPPEGGYLTRVEEGYYHKGGGYKPYVIVPTAKVKQAVNYRPEKTLSDTNTCGEQGQIPIWSPSNGDVIIANQSHSGQGFAYDLPGVGRCIVTGVKNGAFIQGANYVALPSPNFQPWNVRKNVNMNGMIGTMEDYGAGGQAFRAATFDGRLLTGVANKGFILRGIGRYLNLKNINYGYQGIVDGGLKFINGFSENTRLKSAPYIGCVFANSVNLTPFKFIKFGFKVFTFRGNGTGSQPARIELEVGATSISSAGGETYHNESNTVVRDIGGWSKSATYTMTSTKTNAGNQSNMSQQYLTLDVSESQGHHFIYIMLGNIVLEYSGGSVYAVVVVNNVEFIN